MLPRLIVKICWNIFRIYQTYKTKPKQFDGKMMNEAIKVTHQVVIQLHNIIISIAITLGRSQIKTRQTNCKYFRIEK